MRFFDRTEEIAFLRKIREMAKNNAQFTVVTGRRRIGKTSLVWKAYEDEPILYFFVARKAEGDLCEDYRLEIENKLGVPTMGRAEHFTDVFEYLMKLSAERPITLFIDEFQEFFRVNKSVFSDMQRIWDLYSPKSRINLIVCGSIYSMMTKIFKDKKEPLYNRQSRFMTVRPFTPTVLKDILSEYNPGYTAEDLLALYAFTGGVAKYVQLLVDAGATTKTTMLDQIIKADSIFLGEGKAILIEECNEKLEAYEDELKDLPREIERINLQLMMFTMECCYDIMKDNDKQIHETADWVSAIRIELKKRLIEKQQKEQQNQEIYNYMHDIFGAEVVNLFDMKYNPEQK